MTVGLFVPMFCQASCYAWRLRLPALQGYPARGRTISRSRRSAVRICQKETHVKEPTPRERAQKFLTEATQFRLGALLTESFHPRSRNLSDIARRDAAEGLGVLFDVDRDVVERFRRFVAERRAESIRDTVVSRLLNGGRLFFTGCGSTGRLSIQLDSIWRDFWQRRQAAGDEQAAQWEDRTFSVMAGGDFALIKAVEGFEDFTQFGRRQIRDLGVSQQDVVFSITEGGETSFVIGTAWEALEAGAKVYFVYNNPDEILREHVIRSREVLDEPRIEKINLTTGPMAISGSTRMQATTIQLAVLLTVLEMTIREILARQTGQPAEAEDIPGLVLKELEQVHERLASEDLRQELARLVEMEERVYRSGRRNNYYADRLAIDILTDTTERSPTFCVPAFKKFDDPEAAESWSFLFLPYATTEEAWQRLLKRRPRPVEWDLETVRQLIGEEAAERQHRIIRDIGMKEILRFRIGLDGVSIRPLGPGDSATAIVTEEDLPSLEQEDGFFRTRLEEARQAGADTGVVFAGPEEPCRRAQEFVAGWAPEARGVFLQTTDCGLHLKPGLRLGVKMMLNALSTCTMVRLGRVMGNVMIWVVPSNLKLIDRSTRYISQLAGVSYEEACYALFEAIEYVSPRMAAGKAYPAPVGLAVMRLRHGLPFEQAEQRLYEEVAGA